MFPNVSSGFVNGKHREFCVWEHLKNIEKPETLPLISVNAELTFCQHIVLDDKISLWEFP